MFFFVSVSHDCYRVRDADAHRWMRDVGAVDMEYTSWIDAVVHRFPNRVHKPINELAWKRYNIRVRGDILVQYMQPISHVFTSKTKQKRDEKCNVTVHQHWFDPEKRDLHDQKSVIQHTGEAAMRDD